MNPAFIYFDLDDTLLDHRGAETAALRDLYRQFPIFNGTDPDSLIEAYQRTNGELWKEYGKGNIGRSELQRKRFEHTLNQIGVDGSKYEEVGNYYMRAYQNHWSWVVGAYDALKKVSGRYETGILTNGFAETQRSKIEQFSLDEFARHLVISEEVGYLKPQSEIFEHATSLVNRPPAEILYIGDSYRSDIVGGSSFGWKTAWYTGNNRNAPKESGRADFVFDDFQELCDLLEV
ncbi:MAG: HAD family hydrolase [Balneolaceae bacterium]|nr:HAD family hydrolase [Balneolaceae bacterium]